MRIRLLHIPLVAVLTVGAAPVSAQGLPTAQPNYLMVFREEVKPGRNAEHSKLEAGWPAAYQKAGSQAYYLALVSLTGPNEAWFLTPRESFAKEGESMQRDASDAVLSAELDRLSKADGELLNGVQGLQLVARKDLSYGAYPNLAKARFWEISTWRMKPGQDAAFEAAAKAYGAAAARSAPEMSYRIYQVIAGGFQPTFLVFTSVESYDDFDQTMAGGQALWGQLTDGEKAIFARFNDQVMNSVSNKFRLDPQMSYVSADVKAMDPAFWAPPKKPTK